MSSTKKLSNEIVDDRLKDRPIKRLGNYVNAQYPITFQCLVETCNHIWNAKPYNVTGLNKSGCPMCSKYNRPVFNSYVDEKLQGKNIRRISEYKGMQEYMTFECLIDGHVWNAKPYTIVNCNQGCSVCAKRNKHRTNDYVDDFIKDKDFIRIGEYIDTFTRINWQCKIDGHVWCTTFTEIRRGSGCPMCRNKHEKHLKNILIFEFGLLDIKSQYAIQGNDRNYFIDFYVERNGNKIGIEYDGIQHYTPTRFGGISLEKAKENLIKQKIRDDQVNELCHKNNIHLLRIPYWFTDEEIKLVLCEHLFCFM